MYINKFVQVYPTHVENDRPLQSRPQLYITTDVRIPYIIANGSQVPIFSRTISNYFEPIVYFVPSIPRNGSERFKGSLCNLGAPARLRQVQSRQVQAKLCFYISKQRFYLLRHVISLMRCAH